MEGEMEHIPFTYDHLSVETCIQLERAGYDQVIERGELFYVTFPRQGFEDNALCINTTEEPMCMGGLVKCPSFEHLFATLGQAVLDRYGQTISVGVEYRLTEGKSIEYAATYGYGAIDENTDPTRSFSVTAADSNRSEVIATLWLRVQNKL